MDHLACFTSGLLALGVMHGVVEGEKRDLHLKRAISLAETCFQMYDQVSIFFYDTFYFIKFSLMLFSHSLWRVIHHLLQPIITEL